MNDLINSDFVGGCFWVGLLPIQLCSGHGIFIAIVGFILEFFWFPVMAICIIFGIFPCLIIDILRTIASGGI